MLQHHRRTKRTDSIFTDLDKKDPSHEDLPLLYLCLGMIMGLGKRDIPRFEDGKTEYKRIIIKIVKRCPLAFFPKTQMQFLFKMCTAARNYGAIML
jgi:hypothetical protein